MKQWLLGLQRQRQYKQDCRRLLEAALRHNKELFVSNLLYRLRDQFRIRAESLGMDKRKIEIGNRLRWYGLDPARELACYEKTCESLMQALAALMVYCTGRLPVNVYLNVEFRQALRLLATLTGTNDPFEVNLRSLAGKQ